MDIFKDWKDENGLTDKGLKGVTTLGNIANVGLQALAQGNTSIVGNLADTIGGFIPGPWGMGIKAAGNLINAAFGSNINDAAVDAYESDIKGLQNSQYSALDYNNLLAQRQAFNNVSINKEDLGTQGWFGTKLDDTYNTLMEDLQTAKQRNTLAFNTQAAKINDSAFNASVNNMLEYGGSLYDLTGNWNNGLTFINAGGTHEANPFEGVQIGVDPQGVPNLVEEGEIIYNDYVFSNKLKPSKKQLEDNGLNKKYEGWTFAKIVEDMQKESADNPIDFISQNTLKDMMNILITMQEEVRNKQSKNKQSNMFDDGGKKKSDTTNNYAKNFIQFLAEHDHYVNTLGYPTVEKGKEIQKVKEVEKKLGNQYYLPESGYIDNFIESLFSKRKEHKTKSKTNNNKFDDGGLKKMLRYAPVFADASALLYNTFNKPDYSSATRIEQAARNVPGGRFTPLNNYIEIPPLDSNYYLNPLLATSRSTASAIQNQGLNAGQVIAGLNTNQFNTNIGIGQTLTETAKENLNRKLQKEQFNRATDQYNAQGEMQALAMEQQKARGVLEAINQGNQIRTFLDAKGNEAFNQSYSGLTESLAGIGTEATYDDWLQRLIDADVLKDPNKVKNENKPETENKGKYGGKLLTKKRR